MLQRVDYKKRVKITNEGIRLKYSLTIVNLQRVPVKMPEKARFRSRTFFLTFRVDFTNFRDIFGSQKNYPDGKLKMS